MKRPIDILDEEKFYARAYDSDTKGPGAIIVTGNWMNAPKLRALAKWCLEAAEWIDSEEDNK